MAFVPPARHIVRAKDLADARYAEELRVEERDPAEAGPPDGRYWARTSDLQLVELALSQLS